MKVEEFAESYESKTDEDLLRLALHPEQLTPEATIALTNQLAKRRLGKPEQLKEFRESEKQRERKDELAKNTRLWSFRGIGRDRFGKGDYSYDPQSGTERFKTTLFVVVFYLPLIPAGTYVVERKRGFLAGPTRFVERLPLDWKQISRVWGVAAAVVIGLIGMFRLIPFLPWR